MRSAALVVLVLLAAATPALGDDATKKHAVDARISSLHARTAAHRRRETELRDEVAGYTTRIRALEARVGDVSLRLQTLESDLSLHQRRLDALNKLFKLQSDRLTFLKGQYAAAVQALNHRLVDIYESDAPSSLDVFLGANNVQDALDQVAYLTDIGVQDRHIATEVADAKLQAAAARAKTKKLRVRVHGETAVIEARATQARDVRDELVGARNDLSGSRRQRLTDLSQLSRQDRAARRRPTRSRPPAQRSPSGSGLLRARARRRPCRRPG